MDSTLTPLSHNARALRVHEAVAIAQVLLSGDPDNTDAMPPYGPLTPDTVALGPDGTVHCTGAAATPGTADVAILLHELLQSSDEKVPGGLRYALGRALHEVEAPPFDSPSEFATTLQRFEVGSRQQVIADACARMRDGASAASAPEPHGAERRRLGESHARMRRALREADLRLYEAQHPARAPRETAPHALTHRMPMVACVLAGVVLMAVGDSASRAGVAPGNATSSRVARATDIVLPAPQPAAPPAVASVDVRGERLQTPPSPSRPRAVRASANRPASGSRTMAGRGDTGRRTRSRAASARQADSRRDDDRGVIARIRFEWNNPFK